MFRDLTESLLLARTDLICMLTLYCDRSELKQPCRVLAVSGVLSDTEHWGQVDIAWRRALEQFEISRFHMTDFESRYKEFSGWSNERRIQLLSALLNAIKGGVVAGITCAVFVDDYDRLTKEERSVIRHPYSFCAGYVVANTFRFVDKYLGQQNVSFVFEDGDPGKGILLDELSRKRTGRLATRIHSVTLADSSQITPLQAADLVAYESTKAIARLTTDTQRVPRKSLQGLLGALPLFYTAHFRERGLRDFAGEAKAKKQTLAAIRAGEMTIEEGAARLAAAVPGSWPDLLSQHDSTWLLLRRFLSGRKHST